MARDDGAAGGAADACALACRAHAVHLRIEGERREVGIKAFAIILDRDAPGGRFLRAIDVDRRRTVAGGGS